MAKKKSKGKLDKRIVIILAAIVVLAGIIYFVNTKDSGSGPYIAKVNGKKIYSSDVQTFLSETFNAPENFDLSALPEAQQKSLVQQYILEKELIKDAKKSKIHKDEIIAKKIESSNNKIIKEAFLEKMAEEAATRTVIEEEYARLSIELETEIKGKKEVRAKHILVKTKSEADTILANIRINKQSFEEIAKEKSLDTLSGKEGGDLGYFTTGSMVPEFETKAFGTAVGKVSQPFKTKFGWHIVKTIDKRDAQVPTLDVMYPKLKKELSFKVINEYLNTLKDGFEVELSSTTNTPTSKPAPEDEAASKEEPVKTGPKINIH